jgi:RNA polymerase sigma-70 factor (ECF subfamily)
MTTLLPNPQFRSEAEIPMHRGQISNLQSPIPSLSRLFPARWRQVTRFLAAHRCPAVWLEDLAQDVFLRAWQSRRSFRSDKAESFDAYLRTIARNVLREARRAVHRRPQPAQVLDMNRVASHAPAVGVRSELAELLERAKSELSDAQWQAIELTCLRGLTPRQAAKEIGCSPAVLRNRLSDAREKIRKSEKIFSDDLP